MTKIEAVNLLIKNGYNAVLENDKYPMVHYTDEDPVDEVRKLLQENGYNATFGVQRKKQEVKNGQASDSQGHSEHTEGRSDESL